jgi:predicted GNAT superfamily acetyltransferase
LRIANNTQKNTKKSQPKSTKMPDSKKELHLQILDKPKDLREVERLQLLVWPGDRVVPDHLMRVAVQSGGIIIGAYKDENLIGFVFGFVGLYKYKYKWAVKHCSHILGIHPDYQNKGVGYKLKRAQWQLARHQGMELITWTYDPLESRNAYFNIAKLGAVCKTYRRNEYGEMTDSLNKGIPSDRFEVEWWVNSNRVNLRLTETPRRRLGLKDYAAAGINSINETKVNADGWPVPIKEYFQLIQDPSTRPSIVLIEFPSNYQRLKSADHDLAMEWRYHSRTIFELLFETGYLVSDVVHTLGPPAASYYICSFGESTLE